MSTATFGCDNFTFHEQAKNSKLPIHRRFARRISGFLCALRHRNEMRKLMTGDPRLLEDIGITQSDVMSAMSRSILSDPTKDIGARVDRRHAAWHHWSDRNK